MTQEIHGEQRHMATPETAPTSSPTAERLIDRLVRDINLGELSPGEWLKQIDLEKKYGANRLAVRRVLDELVAKRLVQHIPNKGYRIHELSPQQRKEIAEIRITLETSTAHSIVENATAADVAELRALAETFKSTTYDGTMLELNVANLAFHKKLFSLCSNKSLIELIMEVQQRGPAAPATRWRSFAQLEKAANDHFIIADAVQDKDVEALKAAIRSHIADRGPRVAD